MKKLMAASLLLSGVLILLSASVFHVTVPEAYQFRKRDIISCAPSSEEEIVADDNGKFMPVLPGWGHYSYAVSTTSDSAQFYFNQGLNLYYSYHPKEAVASFKEAARFDKTCVMAYWGQALAMGPFYNTYYYKMNKEVPAVVKLMSSYTSYANEKEKALINAMQRRYSEDMTNADRPLLDSNYALALSAMMKEFPADNDIKSFYIDAVMLQHKWDFWYNDGTPKPWTPEVVKLCEDILAKSPGHPAALHYYIHVTEASKHPEVALPGADVLKNAMPGVPHMVHMASHMYQRNGLYAKGVYVNEDANTAANIADSLAPLMGRGRNTAIHYFAVQTYCALNAGMYNKALPVYKRIKSRVIELNGSLEKDLYMQFVYMIPEIAAVRLGKWKQLLDSPSPDRKWKYASSLDDSAKGMAYLHSKNLNEAKKRLHL